MVIKYLLLSIACAFFISCATNPVPTSMTTSVPIGRTHISEYAIQKPNTERVIIKRDSGLLGSACFIHLSINGQNVADLNMKENINVYVPYGLNVFSVQSCLSGLVENGIRIEPNMNLTLRTGFTQSMDLFITPTTH